MLMIHFNFFFVLDIRNKEVLRFLLNRINKQRIKKRLRISFFHLDVSRMIYLSLQEYPSEGIGIVKQFFYIITANNELIVTVPYQLPSSENA